MRRAVLGLMLLAQAGCTEAEKKSGDAILSVFGVTTTVKATNGTTSIGSGKGSAEWRKSMADKVVNMDELPRRILAKHLAEAMGLDIVDGINTSRLLTQHAKSEEEKVVVEALFRWFAQTYAVTLSEAVGISANFPVYDLDQDFALDSITAPHARPLNGDPDISMEVELPPLRVLLSIPPLDLLAIRKDFGKQYFTAMARWNVSAGAGRQVAQRRVATTLQQYASRICERSDERLPVWGQGVSWPDAAAGREDARVLKNSRRQISRSIARASQHRGFSDLRRD